MDFTLRLAVSDLCLNYADLDCISLGQSYIGLNGAEFNAETNLWYFTDDVVLRARPLAGSGNLELRLEIIYAHDSKREQRGYVYSFLLRGEDHCELGFTSRQYVMAGEDVCWEDVPLTPRSSELVSRFLQAPTLLVRRENDKWVFPTPRTSSQVVTARPVASSAAVEGEGVMLAVPVANTQRPAAFVISRQRGNSMMLAAMARESRQCASQDLLGFAPLVERASLFQALPSARSASPARGMTCDLQTCINRVGDPMPAADGRQEGLQALLDCMTKCLRNTASPHAAAAFPKPQLATPNPRRQLKAFSPRAMSRQRRHRRQTRSLQGQEVDFSDDRLLECSRNTSLSVPYASADGASTSQHQEQLLVALQDLLIQVQRLEAELSQLIPLWNSAAAFNWNVVETGRVAYFDLLDLLDRFFARIHVVRQSTNPTFAEARELANVLHGNLTAKLHLSQYTQFWDKYFTSVGGSVGLAALNSVHLSEELVQLRQMQSALELYVLPMFSSASLVAGEEGREAAHATAALVSAATAHFAHVQIDMFNVEQIASGAAEMQQSARSLNQLMEESAAIVAALETELVWSLEPALFQKVEQRFAVPGALQAVAVSSEACRQIQVPCALPTCKLAGAHFAQSFEDPGAASQEPCRNITGAKKLCANTACDQQAMGNEVFLPSTVAMFTRNLTVVDLLQDSRAGEDAAMRYADQVYAALTSFSLHQVTPPTSHLIYTSTSVTNSERILQRLIAAYSPAEWLPRSCLADRFESSSVMQCEELVRATAALRLCEYIPPTQAPTPIQPTASPYLSPTQPPTKFASKRPTTLGPTPRPSRSPTHSSPTASPTTSLPTRAPTPQPSMSPTIAFTCNWPPASTGGCPAIIHQTECDAYTGCTWDVGSNVCNTIVDCSEFDCRIKILTYTHGGRQLPGCRMGKAAQCDLQRRRMFTTLKLGTKCSQTFVPARDGGAWMGNEKTRVVVEDGQIVYVSSESGSDNNVAGTRAYPFKTIARAVAETRRFPEKRHIRLLPGTHRQTQTIDFTNRDKGLTISGEEEGDAIVTGLLSLNDASVTWESWGNAGIIRAKLPASILNQVGTLSQLYVNDELAVRARWPNLENPLGFKYNSATSMVKSWSKRGKIPAPTKVISRVIIPSDIVNTNTPLQYNPKSIPYNKYSLGFGALCSHFSPPASYFCDPGHYAQGGCPYTLPAGVTLKTNAFKTYYSEVNKPDSKNTAFFHTLHWAGWGLWTFAIRSMTANSITFGEGGFQEARGDCNKGGGNFYLENIKALLDFPNEYFLDREEGYLYYYPPSAELNPMLHPKLRMELGSTVRSLFSFVSTSASQPVRGIVLRNIEFTGTYPTLMDKHEVPGGGDWTLVRNATVLLENVEDSVVEECRFRHIGGNALLISKHARNIQVTRNEFYALGSSAVMIVGDQGFESDTPWRIENYPADIRVFGNVMSYFGLVVKQAAGVFVAISKRVDILENVIHSSPRGGLVLNDGFGGGIVMARNTVFDHVLETDDHGIVNSWDRQQYEEEPFGVMKPPFVVEENLLLGTAKGPKGIDLDDGAFNYVSKNNVVVWGYQKLKGSFIKATGNLILFPMESSCVYVTPQTRTPAEFVYANNTCVSWRLPPYDYNMSPAEIRNLCSAKNLVTHDNTFYIGGLGSDPKFDTCSPGNKYNFRTWQTRYGQDVGSTMLTTVPDFDTIDGWVKQKLPWVAAAA